MEVGLGTHSMAANEPNLYAFLCWPKANWMTKYQKIYNENRKSQTYQKYLHIKIFSTNNKFSRNKTNMTINPSYLYDH